MPLKPLVFPSNAPIAVWGFCGSLIFRYAHHAYQNFPEMMPCQKSTISTLASKNHRCLSRPKNRCRPISEKNIYQKSFSCHASRNTTLFGARTPYLTHISRFKKKGHMQITNLISNITRVPTSSRHFSR